MMYTVFTANNKEYKLRLPIRNIVLLEKQLGVNPLAIFGNGDRMPTITEMTYILHASLQQYQHNISLIDAQDIFEAWVNDGNSPMDFINVIIEIYKVSGIIRQDNDEKNV